MGIGGFRLFNWLDRRDDPGPSGQVYAEAMATRAVISGRRTYELAGRWQGDHHDGVPIFVLTHDVPDDPPPGSVRYVTDVRECAAQARAAAGDGDVMVHGAGAAQALLRAGQLDELELHVVPVLLGQGRRLFDNLPARAHRARPGPPPVHPGREEPAQQVTAPALPRPPPMTRAGRAAVACGVPRAVGGVGRAVPVLPPVAVPPPAAARLADTAGGVDLRVPHQLAGDVPGRVGRQRHRRAEHVLVVFRRHVGHGRLRRRLPGVAGRPHRRPVRDRGRHRDAHPPVHPAGHRPAVDPGPTLERCGPPWTCPTTWCCSATGRAAPSASSPS